MPDTDKGLLPLVAALVAGITLALGTAGTPH